MATRLLATLEHVARAEAERIQCEARLDAQLEFVDIRLLQRSEADRQRERNLPDVARQLACYRAAQSV